MGYVILLWHSLSLPFNYFKCFWELTIYQLTFMISKSVGATVSAVVFRILGVIPTSPLAFVTASNFTADVRSANFIRGMPN